MSAVSEVRRGRPRRNAALPEQWRDRQRKGETEDGLGLKLPVPDWVYEKYPKTLFRHRWFRAEKGRMYAKTKVGDWEPVEGVDPVPGAADQHGNPVDHVLCITRLDWWQADRAKKEKRRKQIEEQFRRGNISGGSNVVDGEVVAEGGVLQPDTYTAEVAQANRLS